MRISTWVATRPRRAFVVVGIGALVIGLVGGGVLGFTVEQHRVRSDTRRLRTEMATLNEALRSPAARRPQVRVGTIVSVGATGLNLHAEGGPTDFITTTSSTRYATLETGSAADLAVGGHVIERGHAVFVLPSGDADGRPIAKVSPTEVQVGTGNGEPGGTVKLAGAKIDIARDASPTVAKAGAAVLVVAESQDGNLVATTVLITPATTSSTT